ncbi:DUF2634 domain-containing protein [Parablautia sp. Marseille-Q6255]|uniref:DUF2634 domain-containing protein n=1 Tax=Parablautia sp. Marseille-Q6255 TaxID=3039593 RepID=UPI0024BC454E|nr:DUF2634 domain-containing protein [Parablautia sp. Marseille-Q6255]
MEGASVISVPFDIEGIDTEQRTTRTYGMDMEHKRIVGMVDGEEALKQSIWKMLSTERFKHLIYSDNYGSEIMDRAMDTELTEEFLESDIPELIKDALMIDDRILDVDNISWKWVGRDSVSISCSVITVYGALLVEGVVN